MNNESGNLLYSDVIKSEFSHLSERINKSHTLKNTYNYKMGSRWSRGRRYKILILLILLVALVYYLIQREEVLDIDLTRSYSNRWNASSTVTSNPRKPVVQQSVVNADSPRSTIIKDVERRLEEALKEDRGTGCQVPKMDPFDKEIMKYNIQMPKVVCDGFDWVRCHLSKCSVRKEILDKYKGINCTYEDIIFVTDKMSTLGPPRTVSDGDVYILNASDHVKVQCSVRMQSWFKSAPSWSGYVLGFRSSVPSVTPKVGREDTLNILILGLDSTSKNGFIRRMPKSYKTLKNDIGGVILNSYNILGDGTPAALFPILTGKNELELPDRRKAVSNDYLDDFPFIFYDLRADGYRTAYFEDMPHVGTFQYRFHGFKKQPADHYLRHFYLNEKKRRPRSKPYCVGDTPSYLLMLNATEQFFELDRKKFIFTFIADITHDNFNMISTADEDLSIWLKRFKENGHLENTLLFVMGDHGPRFGQLRNTLAGKLEERLPLMGVRLPDRLIQARPDALSALTHNAHVLTTAHDVHLTVLDALGITYERQARAYSLLETIPPSRSCGEAGIESHWCTCLKWTNVSSTETVYQETAEALVKHINSITQSQRSLCVPRTLETIMYVQRQTPNKQLLKFHKNKDNDGYLGRFDANTPMDKEQYTIKIAVGPGHGIYEASMTYVVKEKKFEIDTRSISRINAYNDEPSCISATNPHMNMYCYCKQNMLENIV